MNVDLIRTAMSVKGLLLLLTLATVAFSAAQDSVPSADAPSKPLDGITFAAIPGKLFVPIKEFGKALGESVSEEDGSLTLGGHPVGLVRHLFNGEGIVPVREAEAFGAQVSWDQTTQLATVEYKNTAVQVHQGDKRVVVDKSSQSLMAYQGGRLVMATHVSTGREGHGTPNGDFTAGPAKERMHRSKLYHFAPMPWSVQVDGNVFIHGYTSVPNRPASHGCIRMPLTRGNPAHYFFNWVDIGTPVTIQGSWNQHYAFRGRRRRSRLASWRRRAQPLYAAKHRKVSPNSASDIGVAPSTTQIGLAHPYVPTSPR